MQGMFSPAWNSKRDCGKCKHCEQDVGTMTCHVIPNHELGDVLFATFRARSNTGVCGPHGRFFRPRHELPAEGLPLFRTKEKENV